MLLDAKLHDRWAAACLLCLLALLRVRQTLYYWYMYPRGISCRPAKSCGMHLPRSVWLSAIEPMLADRTLRGVGNIPVLCMLLEVVVRFPSQKAGDSVHRQSADLASRQRKATDAGLARQA
jgi:hypothetical protein